MISKILKEQFLPQFFLRRTKELLKDQLPKKTEEVVFCPLTPKQIEVYRRIVESEPVQNLVRKDDYCECGSRNRYVACILFICVCSLRTWLQESEMLSPVR